MPFSLALLVQNTLAFDKVPSLISKQHIFQAQCRLKFKCFQVQEDCWQKCVGKTNRNYDIVQVQSNVSIRGCSLVWPPQLEEAEDSSIYQVYTQDFYGAWHNEGQTRRNWINLTRATWARTKSIQLISIELKKKKKAHPEIDEKATNGEHQEEVLVRTSFIPLVMLQFHECSSRRNKTTEAKESSKKYKESNELVNASTYLVIVVTLVVVCLVLILALASILFIVKKSQTLNNAEA